MNRIDAAVIGAGVIGLAIARALALSGRSVVILEREGGFGTVTSARNSEVIHAGLHYPRGSLKELLCIAGKQRLYAYCAARHIRHRRCGKLTFASTPDELPQLEAIAAHAHAAGADPGLAWLEPDEVRAIEPAIRCAGALHSPSSGIIDSHAYMLALLGEAEDHGAMLARHAEVRRLERRAGRWRLHVGETTIDAALVVNAAGLGAQALAAATEGLDPGRIPPLHLAKGNYFTYAGRVPFERLIYPLPVGGGLGVHLTLDMAGQARFGPDVEWVAVPDYSVDPARGPAFLAAVRRFWPEVDPARLTPGYSGIRPKLTGPDEAAADFVIEGAASHGLPGLINLFGIESPGLTASLAIAEHVMGLS
jgi:L-2-hydroxyglutarate oxidase LhgO